MNTKEKHVWLHGTENDGHYSINMMQGKVTWKEIITGARYCHLGMSDGTLIACNLVGERKFVVITKGSAVISIGDAKSPIKINPDKIEWVVCGDAE